MKINFDEIFGTTTDNKKNLIKGSYASQASTSLGFEQLNMHPPHKKRQSDNLPPQKLSASLEKKSINETMRILQSNPKQQSYNWFIESKLDDEENNAYKIPRQQKKPAPKQLTKKQAEILSTRLTQPQRCNKKFCNHLCESQTCRRMNQENAFIFGNHKRSLTQVCQFQLNNPSKLHEYLYYEHKARQFSNIELKKQYEQKYKSNQPFKYQNPNYTTNYVPFYERLDSELEKRANKQQYYDKYAIYSDQVVQFRPDITKSKKSFMLRTKNPDIKPRKQKFQLKGTAQMRELQSLNHSLDKSFESVMNRSVQIIEQKEQKLIVKILTLFEDNGYFMVKPQGIEQLDEKQFEIFCPLISKLEKSQSITIDQFEEKLRKYLKKLPKQDKLALRKNDIMKQKQNNIKIRQQKNSLKSGSQSRGAHTLKSTNSNVKGDYLNKIRNFV